MDTLNADDLSSMMDSAPAKRAINYLKKSSTNTLTKEEALVIRDFLITKPVLENGQRPGPLETACL